jgi:hypothetical protein
MEWLATVKVIVNLPEDIKSLKDAKEFLENCSNTEFINSITDLIKVVRVEEKI